MREGIDENTFICITSCHKCRRHIEVEFHDGHFEAKENVTFLGRMGTETFTYCPYCGVRQTGFSPYDPQQKINLFPEDDDDEEPDEEDSWWPDAEGVTLIDEEEDDTDSGEMDDESDKESFTCSSCGETFSLNPRGCNQIYCYYCGKAIL